MLTIAGMIWGEESAVSENTEGIILESATFEGEGKENIYNIICNYSAIAIYFIAVIILDITNRGINLLNTPDIS